MRWIGHAGMALDRPAGAPTRGRLDLAVTTGVDLLELDVAASADGELLLLHDLELPDGTRVEGAPGSELRRRVRGLLTLDEGLEHLCGRVPALLDLKGTRVVVPLAARLSRAARPEVLAVCTDDVAALLRLRYTAPRVARWRTLPAPGSGRGAGRRRILAAIRRSTLARDLRHLAAEVAAAGICVDRWAVTPALGEAARRLRLELDAWTVNDLPAARRMARCGVGLLTSDLVATLRPALAGAS